MAEFEDIYETDYPIVYRYVLSLCRNGPTAEEITQEAFVKAMEHLDRFDGKCRRYVWICQIAKNTYYTYLKKQKRFLPQELPPPEAEADPEEQFFDKETAGRIYPLLDRLPEPYKQVFSLRVFGELSFSQIGALLNKTDSWARLTYYRAKKRIKEDLHE